LRRSFTDWRPECLPLCHLVACTACHACLPLPPVSAAAPWLQNYLHTCKPPIIHRDLKSPNLLVDDAGRVKVGGAGAAPSSHAPLLPL
jgi:serine/threonine protein kinase